MKFGTFYTLAQQLSNQISVPEYTMLTGPVIGIVFVRQSDVADVFCEKVPQQITIQLRSIASIYILVPQYNSYPVATLTHAWKSRLQYYQKICYLQYNEQIIDNSFSLLHICHFLIPHKLAVTMCRDTSQAAIKELCFKTEDAAVTRCYRISQIRIGLKGQIDVAIHDNEQRRDGPFIDAVQAKT